MSGSVGGADVVGSEVVRRTRRRLADGREILYFDLPGSPERAAVDERPLGERAPSGEIRQDPLTGEWVGIAAHRQSRTFLPPANECPLCPTGRGSVPSEIPETDYQVAVFENRFPSFAPVAAPGPEATGSPLWRRGPAVGRTEVVCFTSAHEGSFVALAPEQARMVVEAWADRTAELGRQDGVEQVYCFENRGPEIGVTLPHPHGQVYAYPYLPPRAVQLLDRAQEHRASTGRLLGADLLDAERAHGARMVLSAEHWSAYVPFAARWPVEVHLVPHRDVPDLPALTAPERDELVTVYLELLARLDRYFVGPQGETVPLPYVSGWQQAPSRVGRDVSRLFLQVFTVLRSPGRLKYLAGSESGAGAWVSDVLPEQVAARLREVAS